MKPNVVVGYDPSPPSERALEEAAAEAEWRAATLTVVHAYHALSVAPPPLAMVVPGHDTHQAHEAAFDVVEQGADAVRAGHPGLTVEPRALAGSAATVLAEASEGADLLVVGHRGPGGFPGLGLGSVALRAVTRASVPSLVVRGAGDGARGTVLAAVDLADDAEELLDFAFAEATHREARLQAISAWEFLWPPTYFGDPGHLRRAQDLAWRNADAALARTLRPWRKKYPDVVAEHKLADGSPTTVLVAATTYADLIVVGAHRRVGHGVHLGPVAHTLLRHADCPVAVVPYG